MQYQFSDCLLDIDAHTLTRNGDVVQIEPQVFDLLHLLLRNAETLVTRDQMIDEIWQGRIVSESAISARIAAVRRAVGDDGRAQSIIQTVPRRGLKFVADLMQDQKPEPKSETRDAPRTIKFTTANDGVSLAYAMTGTGPPILHAPHFPTHLELDWHELSDRPLLEALGKTHTLVSYDQRGCGLSELNISEITVERSAADIKQVTDAAGLNKFALFGSSGGVMAAVRFAAMYPERLTHLILLGGYVDGRSVRDGNNNSGASETIENMVREGWETPDSAFVSAYVSIYFPTATTEELRYFTYMLQNACPIENALMARIAHNVHSISDVLSKVCAPTLVLHCRGDAVHPLSEGQKLARGIAGAEFLVLDSLNHYPLPHEPSWRVHVDAMQEFLNRA